MNDHIIYTYLMDLGFPVHLSGTTYAATALRILLKEPDLKLMLLYAQVGAAHNSTGSRVERAIRHAIGFAMDHNPEFFQALGLPAFRWGSSLPNSEFLCTALYQVAKEAQR